MPGPNSCPNGDTRVMRGHVNEVFVCEKHGDKETYECSMKPGCKLVPLRDYLYKRNRLVTGKTR